MKRVDKENGDEGVDTKTGGWYGKENTGVKVYIGKRGVKK